MVERPSWDDRAAMAVRNSRNHAAGDVGERMARSLLESFGVRQVRRIETGWTVIRRGARIVSAFPKEKVSGDWRGVLPYRVADNGYFGDHKVGRSVMAEAKEREGRLIFSDLKKHQHAELAEHAELGGASFLIWYCPNVAAWLLPYPLVGFVPHSSITQEAANRDCLQRIAL